MRKSLFVAAIALVGLPLAAERAEAVAPVTQLGSSVAAGFYSNLGTPAMQDPSAFGYVAPAIGAYPHFVSVMGATPLPPIYPGLFTGNNFQSAGGYTNNFNDGLPIASRAVATSIIADSYLPISTNLEDISVTIPGWRVRQAPGATGYVVNQLNFDSVYMLPAGSSLGTSGATLPLTVKGIFGPAGYAQFDAVMSYTYTPFINTAGTPGIPVPLGDIRYAFDAATPNLPFTATVSGVNSLAALGVQPNSGILEIHGHAWIAGDPFDLEATLVPEPTCALALVGLPLVLRRRRKEA